MLWGLKTQSFVDKDQEKPKRLKILLAVSSNVQAVRFLLEVQHVREGEKGGVVVGLAIFLG